jgi:protein-S-isoprenylcysteine O-methyltransferase Ste14
MPSAADGGAPRSKGAGRARLVTLWICGLGLVAFGLAGRPDPVGWAIGVVVSGLGVAVRSWAAGFLIKSESLVTAGPYAYVRNPLYLGRALIGSGLCVAVRLPEKWPVPAWPWPNVAALALFLAFFLGWYMPRKERVEPARLLERHGEEYARYRDSVGSVFPNFARRYDRRSGSWGWARYVRLKEFIWVAGWAAVFGALGLRAFGAI